jgi:DNA-directed RNA polymerase specialized sigma24 family protein
MSTPGSSERRADPGFVLTLPHLQRLYGQNRGLMVRAARDGVPGPTGADLAVQEAFAAAARNRFAFRSERAAIAWLRADVAERLVDDDLAGPIRDREFDWADVLRRANIGVVPHAPGDEAGPPEGRLRALLRTLGRSRAS